MTKSEQRKLESKEREWELTERGLNRRVRKFLKTIGRIIKEEASKMMYNRKPKNKIDRKAEEFFWWVKLIIIFFAFKGFTYWLTGR
jgi:hypothetical protein